MLVVWNALTNNVTASSIKANYISGKEAPSDLTLRSAMSVRSRRVTSVWPNEHQQTLSFYSNAEHLRTLKAYTLQWDKNNDFGCDISFIISNTIKTLQHILSNS